MKRVSDVVIAPYAGRHQVTVIYADGTSAAYGRLYKTPRAANAALSRARRIYLPLARTESEWVGK